MGISLIHSCASLVQLRTHPQVSFLPCGLDCILSPHTHTVCRPIPVQSLRRKHSLLQSKAVKQCSSSLSFSTQDSPRYQMNNSCMLGCYHRGRPLTEIPQRVSTLSGVVPALAAQADLLFQICLRTWGPLFKECRSSTQKINNNKQCRCLALCAPLGGLGFSPHLSHPTGDAPKQRNKQRIAMLVSAAASSCCCHSFCELDDEAFGYLKRVIVTPAVDSRLA